MSLFSDWQGHLTLPPSPVRKTNIGIKGNAIAQQAFRGGCFWASVFPSEFKGYHLIKTKLDYPFNAFLLRQKNALRIKTNYLVLSAPELEKISELSAQTKIIWDDATLLEEEFGRPEQILESWKEKFFFKEEADGLAVGGLRPPQIGALHALAAHFSVGSAFERATVVLPTGTGKTETMLAWQVYKRLPLTLVLVPSNVLRNQIFGKFISLGMLPFLGIVPSGLIGPNVARLTKGLSSIEEAKSLTESANVIVALPQTLKACTPDARDFIINQCSDLVVDEAHHIPASQWTEISDRFRGKRVVQFTATPYRQDDKHIDGKIIFNFKLGAAQASGYYKPINLVTVENFGSAQERDRCVAEAALKILRNDIEGSGFDHILMARCWPQERAKEVFRIYSELAPELHPQLVLSGSGTQRQNKESLDKLINRTDGCSHIVVCVDMLGEGFDLPNLKVAALHDIHKSLAITLQFIGRFTRKGNWERIGDATVVANTADLEIERKLESLYAEGADWDGLIKRLSEERIEAELQLQDVVQSLRSEGNLHEHLSLWNLRPSFSTQIFRTDCPTWTPHNFEMALPNGAESWHAISRDDNILVAVVHQTPSVRWGRYQDLCNVRYDLIVVRWDKVNNALFVCASDYEAVRSVAIANAVSNDCAELLQGPAIFNILNNVQMPLVKNLGSSRIGAISFTSYFGPNVTDGLASIEKAESALNNIACVGYENGDRVLWGGAQKKGKVWQQAAGTILEWVEWTKRTWDKVITEDAVDTNITRDFLRPQRLDKAYDSFPIGVQFGEQAQAELNDRQFIVFGDVEVPLCFVDLEISHVHENGDIVIKLSSEQREAEYKFSIGSQYKAGYIYQKFSGDALFFRRGKGNKIELSDYFVTDPIIVRYSDGTYSYNCYHIPVNLDAVAFPRDRLESWRWDGIPLNQESIGKKGDQKTIQYLSSQAMVEEYDFVFNDDGKGEAADLVCLRNVDEGTIKLCLVHCKGAINGIVSNNIENFYTVCGQAQKSVSVKHAGIKRLYCDLKRRQELWADEGHSRFLKGDMKMLSYFRDKSRKAHLEFEVVIVQPGASKSSVSEDILKLLGTTELYVKTTTQGDFRVVVSP